MKATTLLSIFLLWAGICFGQFNAEGKWVLTGCMGGIAGGGPYANSLQ